uniref:Uncharacterized protein n=1 Tax=Rhizophora mucronata TaxID=61149 RepID=A0A2P2M553_RHIMU
MTQAGRLYLYLCSPSFLPSVLPAQGESSLEYSTVQ